MSNETPDKPYEEMTVKELREIARDIPGLTGVHSMKKDELLAAVTGGAVEEKAAPAPPKATPKPAKKTAGPSVKTLSTKQIKELIVTLRAEKKSAQEAKDKNKTAALRRKINRLKKRSRKGVAASA